MEDGENGDTEVPLCRSPCVRRSTKILNVRIGQIVARHRKQQNVSLRVLAKRARLAPWHVAAVERATAPGYLYALDRIGWALGVDPCDIIERADTETIAEGLRQSNRRHARKQIPISSSRPQRQRRAHPHFKGSHL